MVVRSQPEQMFHKTLSRKTQPKKGLVEWLKALNSNPSTAKKKSAYYTNHSGD
jgi:hypothetical protein